LIYVLPEQSKSQQTQSVANVHGRGTCLMCIYPAVIIMYCITFAVCKTCNSLAAWWACRRKQATVRLGLWKETICRNRWDRWSTGARRVSSSSSNWPQPRHCLASLWARRTTIYCRPDCFWPHLKHRIVNLFLFTPNRNFKHYIVHRLNFTSIYINDYNVVQFYNIYIYIYTLYSSYIYHVVGKTKADSRHQAIENNRASLNS